jgi:hypothetical protein
VKDATNLLSRPLIHASAVLALLASSAFAQSADVPDAGAQTFDAAMQAYERNHWNVAYAAFTKLADQGHSEAARIALQMVRHGPALYRMSFAANAHQLARWSRVRACADQPAGSACQVVLQAL